MSYLYAFGTLEPITGTVDVEADSTTVVGHGTTLDDDFPAAGTPIIIDGVWRGGGYFGSLPSPELMTVDDAWPATLSGVTAYRLALDNLDTGLGIPAPKGVFVPYSQPLDLGSGGVRGAGWATAEWRWGFLSQAHREILRETITGSSAQLLIRTSVNDDQDAFYIFLAQAIWPAAEEKQAGRRLGFTLRFRALQQKTFAVE